jgi:4-hydroxybenzoate polyprenyltransferase
MKNQTSRTENSTFFRSLQGLILLARPVDGVIIGSTGVLGMIITLRVAPSFTQIIMGFLGGIFLLGGLDTFNDILDIESDKISKPWRPLPQGRVKPHLAFFVAMVETISAVVIGLLFFEFTALLLGFIGIFIAIAYSKWLKFYKRSYLTKNLVVAFSLSLALITGVFAVNPTPSFDFSFLLVQMLVFVAALVFEIHKDLGDIQGDIALGVKTLPTQLGINRTVQVLSLGYFLAWGIAFSFSFILGSDPLYFGILILTAVLLMLILYLLVKYPETTIELTRRMTTLVMGMILLGLARLFLL